MTLSGAFAAAAAVRRRPQHLVSHSARPGLQGLLLLCCTASYVQCTSYMLCYSAVLLRTYTIHLSWHHLCFIRPEQQHFALLGNTTLKHTHVSSEACVARCSDLPVSNAIAICTVQTLPTS